MTEKETALLVMLQKLAQATCRCNAAERMSGHRTDCQLANLEDDLIQLHQTFNEVEA